MAERKAFLLRIDPEIFAALQRWAADELRSLNGQIEFLLRRTVEGARRLPTSVPAPTRPAARRSAVERLPVRIPDAGWDAKED